MAFIFVLIYNMYNICVCLYTNGDILICSLNKREPYPIFLKLITWKQKLWEGNQLNSALKLRTPLEEVGPENNNYSGVMMVDLACLCSNLPKTLL